MSCVPKETLIAYAEDDLSAKETRGVKAHLSTCARCRSDLLLLRRMDEVLAEEPLSEPSPAFTRTVMARVAPQPNWMESRWRYVAWAAFVAVAVWFSLWTDWGEHLGRTSERVRMRVETQVEVRLEKTILSMEARRDLAMGRFADWMDGWKQRVHAGLESVGRVGDRPWFLPLALISLIGFALYQFLSFLYEDRRPGIVGR
ncbi:MAG: zf-HC2 domain-containing protein [Candidatus Latescibacteria bacterium]|nr:zf-HC2 domain-containing protein [Candidatus Latescibacterota bacterium]